MDGTGIAHNREGQAMRDDTQRLLRQVAFRDGLDSLAQGWHLFALLLAGVYALLLLCSRMLALIPNWFDPLTAFIPAGAALLPALILRRRPSPARAARLVDCRADTRDLFLNAALIESAIGDYKPLVLSQAEELAPTIRARKVVPFHWWQFLRNVLCAVLILLAGVFALPQLDPFGKEEQRRLAAERRERLEDSRKATFLRAALLQRNDTSAGPSKEIEQELEDLKRAFDIMKRDQPEANLKRLTSFQSELGQLWRERREERLRDALSRTPTAARFPTGDVQKSAQWQNQLQKGDMSGLKKEIDELKQMARKLGETSDPAKKEELRQAMAQRLQNMASSLSSGLNSTSVNAALDRAMKELEMSGAEGLSQEALQALQESLDLTELELAAIAQSIRDLAAIEEALEAIQLAKLCNAGDCLDGEACKGCKGIGDYAALYERLIKDNPGLCQGGTALVGLTGTGATGAGLGMGDRGMGAGNVAPEDPDALSAFQTERSRSALTAGKVLLSWKTRGLSDPGEAREEYVRYVEEIKQGASEAILHEQIPATYHGPVKDYFDTMEEALAEPADE